MKAKKKKKVKKLLTWLFNKKPSASSQGFKPKISN